MSAEQQSYDRLWPVYDVWQCALLQDGLARLTLDADKLPAIQPIKKTKNGAGAGGDSDAQNKQLIINLSMQEWRVCHCLLLYHIILSLDIASML